MINEGSRRSLVMGKFIFVVGGVMSGVGKGVASASIGKILQAKGYSVTAIKIDPYINVDAGTMNPTEHGEVFVTEDGDETDQDGGNYERFLDANFYSTNYMTTGRVYQSVIEKERNLEYGGACVEVVPHIPQEIINRIIAAQKRADAEITIVEVGGTVGEYQNLLFLEAARMLKMNNMSDVVFVLVSFLPIPAKIGEMKTKPTQYAVRTLNSAGIQPDFVICRAAKPIDEIRKKKIAIGGNLYKDHIISAPDIDSIYEVPLNFEKEHLGDKILKQFGWSEKYDAPGMQSWRDLVHRIKQDTKSVKIGIVGKYFQTGDYVLKDSYISVLEAVKHACWTVGRTPQIDWLDAGEYEKNDMALSNLSEYDGIIVPGGFGVRGVEGKIKAIKYVRENNIPFLGLCYGMQLATVEFARNVAGITGATTAEVNSEAEHQVIHTMADQVKNIEEGNYGATMRLGAYPCVLNEKSTSYRAYGEANISERHRHRYEFNNAYREQLETAGLLVAGTSPDNRLVEIIEIIDHPFFIGVQFHPEFKSRPINGHPLFNEFIRASIGEKRLKNADIVKDDASQVRYI